MLNVATYWNKGCVMLMTTLTPSGSIALLRNWENACTG